MENTFVNANAAATLKLGQARGIAMLVPARAGLSVAEYAPNVVKKTVVGAGHGDKAQIRMMIGVLLPKADPQSRGRRRRAGHRHHATRIIAASIVFKAKWRRPNDRQTQRHRRQLRRGLHHPRRQRRRLSGALLGAHAAGAAVARRGRRRCRSKPTCARIRSSCSASPRDMRARMVPPAADGAGRRRQGRAVGARHAEGVRTRLCDCDARQGGGVAHARRRAQGRRAHRHRVEGQGARLHRRSIRRWSICPERSTNSARRSR